MSSEGPRSRGLTRAASTMAATDNQRNCSREVWMTRVKESIMRAA
jgi:hypothetical protein